MKNHNLPVAIIGAGPIGLAAAAHLIQRGETPIVFEAGKEIAANVRSWAHVSLFSPWRWCLDKASVALLKETGWQEPALDTLPTGGELIDAYLLPLAQTPQLRHQIHLNARVTGVSRRRIDKMKEMGREDAPFVVQVELNGEEEIFLARAVIDATGSWATQNPIGSDGMLAPGERANRNKIFYGIPDVLGKHKARYAGKRVAVVGGGHSAINAILELMDLHDEAPETHVTWVLRKADVSATYGGLENDQLPGRGLLGVRIKQLVEAGAVEVVSPFFATRIEGHGDGVRLIGDMPSGVRAITVDEVISATGCRPDLSFLREVRLDLHQGVEAPSAIAPLIDPNYHSCGSVPPHGEKELRHPEAGFYMVGMKSYGRAPTFLLATGYEQVRSVVAALVGDWQAAADVQLELPETGVCGVPAAVDANGLALGGGCCGSTPARATTPALISLASSSIRPAPIALEGFELSATDLAATDLAVPDLAVPDLAVPDLAGGSACCGVEGCCTPAATVASDSCCTTETRAAVAVQQGVEAGSCCGG